MKQIIFISIFVLISSVLFAQDKEDIVYLKNGSVIKGQITEIVPDKHVKIEIYGGNVLVFTFAEIEKIEKVEVDGLSTVSNDNGQTEGQIFSDYYNQSSLGVALAGGGLLGLTYRYFPTEKKGFEGGIFYRPGYYMDYEDEFQSTSGVMFALGPVFYLRAFENGKGKIKKNGISVKAGISPFGKMNEFFGTVNWVHDTYKPENKNRYFSFELGAGAIYRYEMPSDISLDVNATAPLLYLKLNWFFDISE
jgi:hypothetical protein